MSLTQQYNKHIPSPGARYGTFYVKKKGMSKKTHLAWFPMCTTFTHVQSFFIITSLCAVNVKIPKSLDIALIVNRLHVSRTSFTYNTDVGRSDVKSPYFPSSSIEVLNCRNRSYHLNTNA